MGSDQCDRSLAAPFHRTRLQSRHPICLCEFLSLVSRVICGSHRVFLWFVAEDSERNQQRPASSAALNHNNKRDLSLGLLKQQERSRGRLSLVNLSNSSSRRREGLCSAIRRPSSNRPEGRYLGALSSLHSQLVGRLGTQQPNNSNHRVDLCSEAPQTNQLRDLCLGATQPSQVRLAGSLAHSSPLSNSRVGRFLVVHNNQLSNKEPPSLGALSNPPPDRRHRFSGRRNNNLPVVLRCLITTSSSRRGPLYSGTHSSQDSAPHPPSSLSSKQQFSPDPPSSTTCPKTLKRFSRTSSKQHRVRCPPSLADPPPTVHTFRVGYTSAKN